MSVVISYGNVKVELNGKPFCISVDTFDHDDWFSGYFDTEEAAIQNAKDSGGQMMKCYAYNAEGRCIGEGGTF